mgnify:CR=1 FL=1
MYWRHQAHGFSVWRLVVLNVSELDADGFSVCQGLYDKGKGALMRDETRFIDSSTGDVVAVAVGGSFIRGLTGFEVRRRSRQSCW